MSAATECGLWCELAYAQCDEYATHSFRDGGMLVDACDSCDQDDEL